MRADSPLRVKHAELVGSSGVMEDRIFIGKKSVIVLDGATQADQTIEQTGGWIADQIGQRFSSYIETNDNEIELTELLAQAIGDTRDEYNLVPGRSPSTTVSAVRFTPNATDLVVLGDSAALSCCGNRRTVEVLQDCRLEHTTASIRKPRAKQNGSREWQAYYQSLNDLRNKADGFWIAEADPSAAAHAKKRTLDLVAAIVLCTDGVSALVDKYLLASWEDLFEAAQNPEKLLDDIVKIEKDDPDRIRFSRSKVSDDKMVALAAKSA